MVAKITVPKSIEAALNYNEKKVQKGQAECLYAGNYLSDANKMSFYQKLSAFKNLQVLNERATTKTLHVSLNFDPSEKLSNEKLSNIASLYMQKIGFGDQPFLVYQHFDAGHPHLHVVSTTIRADGSRINTHNIGRNQSEQARKDIEQLYKLVKAGEQKQLAMQPIKVVDLAKAVYGKSETKRSIANVVSTVVAGYKFTSLPELNAALKQYNIVADRGSEDGRIYKHRGLVYRLLNAEGNKIGVPIKASSIASKPTLSLLEEKFAANELSREPLKQKTKAVIDEVLAESTTNLRDAIAELAKKQIYTVIRQNSEGRIYGITFVDNNSKCVFNGSDLGKQYSVGALQSRINTTETSEEINVKQEQKAHAEKHGNNDTLPNNIYEHQRTAKEKTHNENLLDQLMTPKEQFDNVPFQLLKKKSNKKKRNL